PIEFAADRISRRELSEKSHALAQPEGFGAALELSSVLAISDHRQAEVHPRPKARGDGRNQVVYALVALLQRGDRHEPQLTILHATWHRVADAVSHGQFDARVVCGQDVVFHPNGFGWQLDIGNADFESAAGIPGLQRELGDIGDRAGPPALLAKLPRKPPTEKRPQWVSNGPWRKGVPRISHDFHAEWLAGSIDSGRQMRREERWNAHDHRRIGS